MNIYLEIVLRTVFTIFFLLFLCRLDGPKQISQMTFYDYVVGITAGSIAAVMALDTKISLYLGIICVAMFMLSSMLFSVLTSKSIILRRALSGNPIFLIARGKINYKGLKRGRIDMDDLMRELRAQGYFDLSAINYAILENNGSVSVMPKSAWRPATSSEAGITLAESSVFANAIIDGKIMQANLGAFNRNKDWVMKELGAQGVELKDVALATLSPQGELSVFVKWQKDTIRTIFQ